MPQGNYDHPSYIVRQQLFLGKSVAGAAGTFGQFASPVSDIVVRKVALDVVIAGTSTSTYLVRSGTTSIGQVIIGTQAASTIVLSGDCNTKVAQGSVLNILTGIDATGVVTAVVEMNIAPDTGTWT